MGYLDRSADCDHGNHADCNGTVTIMEQDGPNRYVCKCGCHPQHTTKTCPQCGGDGWISVTIPPLFGPRVKGQAPTESTT